MKYIVINTNPEDNVTAIVEGRAVRRAYFEGSFAQISVWELGDTYDADSFTIEMNKRLGEGYAYCVRGFWQARRRMEALMEREFKLMQSA